MRFKGDKLLHFIPDFTVIDLETTGRGTDYREITEMSAIRYRNYKPVASFSVLVKPQSPILPFVENLTGITDEMLKDKPNVSEVIEDFVSFVGDDVIVGHNVNFDFNLVYDAYLASENKIMHNDYMDTLNLSRILNEDASSHKLEHLCQYYAIDREVGHRGLEDCKQTGELYIKMSKKAVATQKLFVLGVV
mgnify:FL=1